MSIFHWEYTYNTGVASIDQQHKHFVDICDSIFAEEKEGQSNEDLADSLEELIYYAKFHFKSEENHIKRHNPAWLAEHTEKHNELLERVEEKCRSTLEGKARRHQLKQFLFDWLVKHIIEEDKKVLGLHNR